MYLLIIIIDEQTGQYYIKRVFCEFVNRHETVSYVYCFLYISTIWKVIFMIFARYVSNNVHKFAE